MDTLHSDTQTQILRFQLAGENYAFDVLKTREVLTMVKVTPLPTAMDYLSGVINLRGTVIPVVDLRKKFSLPVQAETVDTSIIIVEVNADGETTVIGAVVDAVKGVMLCNAKDLEPPPRFGMKMNTSLIRSIAKKDGAFVIILDTDKVFSEKELWLVGEESSEPAPVGTEA